MIRVATTIMLIGGALFASASWSQTFDAKARALDGDTVAVDFRLLGVDAFERGQLCQRVSGCWQCGKVAQEFAANALRSKTATIRLVPSSSSSSYGRPVAVVTVDGADLGERLIRAGLATPQANYLRGDPVRLRTYNAAFIAARQRRAGAFAGDWIEPSRWRRGERLSCER